MITHQRMSATDLCRLAKDTAHDYLVAAQHSIDALCGPGYWQKHPELLVGYMQTAALDYLACWHGQVLEVAIEALTESQMEVSDSITKLAQACEGISTGVAEIGEALARGANNRPAD